MFSSLTIKETKAVSTFCDVFIAAIGPEDRRGLLLLKIAEDLERREQRYSARLFREIALEYGY
jgi:hypothetical protein